MTDQFAYTHINKPQVKHDQRLFKEKTYVKNRTDDP
jgi:hypothetical protein